MIRAVTFDLDDTFWPIAPVIERAERQLWAWLEHHHPRVTQRLDNERLRELRESVMTDHPELAHDLGAMRRMMLTLAMRPAGCGPADIEQAYQVFFMARNEVQFFEDVHETLTLLRGQYRLAAISNGNADIHRTGLADHLELQVSASEVGSRKPAPAIFEHTLRRLDLEPFEVVHVGDDLETDVAGARRAGMHAVWLNRAGSPAGRQPVPIIRSLRELPDYLESIQHP